MVLTDVIGEAISRSPYFVAEARKMIREIHGGMIIAGDGGTTTLDVIDVITHAMKFAWENGEFE